MGKRAKADAAQARRHRRRRRRDHDEPGPGESLRHRRDHRHRRRLHQLDLTACPDARRRRSVPTRVRAALPRKGLLARQVAAPTCSSLSSSRPGRNFSYRRRKAVHLRRNRPPSDNLALNLLELGLKPLDRVVPTLPNCAEFVHAVLRAAEDRLHPDRRARHAPLRRDQPVRGCRRGHVRITRSGKATSSSSR